MSNKFNYFGGSLKEAVAQRCRRKQEGTMIGKLELEEGLFVELLLTESRPGVKDKVVVWLCHEKTNRKMNSFYIRAVSQEPVCLNAEMAIIIRLKFMTEYADLKKTYVKKYCN